MRLIVTGENSAGQSLIVADRIVTESEFSGGQIRARFVWGRDSIATLPESGEPPALSAGMPPAGGCRFSTLSIAPGATGEYHAFIVSALGEFAEPREPGFHTTPTIDYIYVISGEFTLEVDCDQQTLLEGDVAVLNGNRHRWHNHADTTATLLAVSVGASRRELPNRQLKKEDSP